MRVIRIGKGRSFMRLVIRFGKLRRLFGRVIRVDQDGYSDLLGGLFRLSRCRSGGICRLGRRATRVVYEVYWYLRRLFFISACLRGPVGEHEVRLLLCLCVCLCVCSFCSVNFLL